MHHNSVDLTVSGLEGPDRIQHAEPPSLRADAVFTGTGLGSSPLALSLHLHVRDVQQVTVGPTMPHPHERAPDQQRVAGQEQERQSLRGLATEPARLPRTTRNFHALPLGIRVQTDFPS